MAEARLNKEYAFRLIGVGALMLGICIWSLYDGFLAWPKVNQQMDAARPALLATNLTAEAWMAKDLPDGRSMLEYTFAKQKAKVPSKLTKKIKELWMPDKIQENRDQEIARRSHAVIETFKKPIYTQHDLTGQSIQAGIALIFSLLAFSAVVGKVGKNYVADDQGLSGSGFRKNFGYDQIKKVDWKRWKEKGIAILFLEDGSKIKLDAWHFRGITDVVAEIKQKRPDLATD